MTNFFNVPSPVTTSTTRAERPSCFGLEWDPIDRQYCGKCPFFSECADEFGRAGKKEAGTTPRVPPPPPASPPRPTTASTTSPTSHASTTTLTSIQRPDRLSNLPLGSEYTPPGEPTTPFQRAISMALAEAVAAAGAHFFDAIARFIRDPANWHRSAGTHKYGERYEGKPRKR